MRLFPAIWYLLPAPVWSGERRDESTFINGTKFKEEGKWQFVGEEKNTSFAMSNTLLINVWADPRKKSPPTMS